MPSKIPDDDDLRMQWFPEADDPDIDEPCPWYRAAQGDGRWHVFEKTEDGDRVRAEFVMMGEAFEYAGVYSERDERVLWVRRVWGRYRNNGPAEVMIDTRRTRFFNVRSLLVADDIAKLRDRLLGEAMKVYGIPSSILFGEDRS